MSIVIVYTLAFLINIPFGYRRERYEKLTLKWFLMIHAPIPIVVGLRFLLGIELTFTTFVISLFSAVAGQLVGSRIIYRMMAKRVD